MTLTPGEQKERTLERKKSTEGKQKERRRERKEERGTTKKGGWGQGTVQRSDGIVLASQYETASRHPTQTHPTHPIIKALLRAGFFKTIQPMVFERQLFNARGWVA